MLMHVMTTNLTHTAGFKPKGLVFKYPDLPAPEKVHSQKLQNVA